MEFHLLYWHWLVIGMLLIVAELFVPSFTIIWFGAAAVIVGLVAWIGFEPELTWQILLWIIVSIALTVAWFRFIKPLSTDRTKAGISREAIVGERGLLIKSPTQEGGRGEVRFSVPVLGSETWPCFIDGQANVGDIVIVKDVLGNTLLVSSNTSGSSKGI